MRIAPRPSCEEEALALFELLDGVEYVHRKDGTIEILDGCEVIVSDKVSHAGGDEYFVMLVRKDINMVGIFYNEESDGRLHTFIVFVGGVEALRDSLEEVELYLTEWAEAFVEEFREIAQEVVDEFLEKVREVCGAQAVASAIVS